MTNETARALEELHSGDSVALWEAAKLLIDANDAGAIPQLLALLIQGTDDERRVAAASVLGTWRVAEASPTLRGILDDRNETPALREQAAESLGYLADHEARDVLIRNLSDDHADVVFSCAFALRFVGIPDDVTPLTRLATDSTLTNSYGRAVALEARQAIEEINWRSEQ
ncbi:MAG TPA: HEAT repeat domain-containing protein [Vicinamibacterales bacterium]|nr:HEAT repeat domain-containing protein [Vicinamibacterales bacterium]